jgi:uncharacterized repeat protein (TIGR01451 family)
MDKRFPWNHIPVFALVLTLGLLWFPPGPSASARTPAVPMETEDDIVFIHHSCGSAWLSNSLHVALLAKDYIDERNDITYGTDVSPDVGRPDSLSPTPGDRTNMNHWILWFNDYLDGVKAHGSDTGFNRIIMFKSCYPISDVTGDGTEPGDPFSSAQTLANYKAVYRHPDGPGHTYTHNSDIYRPLEDIFAQNPDILFVPVTAPPLHYAPSDATSDDNAHRARLFNEWLKQDWLAGYDAVHPGLNNVAVFDWFDVLAYPDDYPDHPNRLREEYGGASGNSHPNSTASAYSTQVFATNPDNWLDRAWNAFVLGVGTSQKTASSSLAAYGQTITYTVVIRDIGVPLTATLHMTDELPTGLAYVPGTLTATSGTYTDTYAPGLYWSGVLTPTLYVSVSYAATVTHPPTGTVALPRTNTAVVAAAGHAPVYLQATVWINPYTLYLPLLLRA